MMTMFRCLRSTHRSDRLQSRGRRLHLTAALSLAATLCACGGNQSASAEQEVIRIDGSSTVYPITEAVAEEFQGVTPGARVTVGISGTGGGFEKFCRGETDISDASRPIRQVEVDRCAEGGIDFIELPVAYDGITVVVNPRNTWTESLTVPELKALWEPQAEGVITTWAQVHPGWPDREIHLFGPGVDSGTFDYFTEAVVGESGASRGDFTSSEDDNVLVQGILGDELALGFFGYAYYEENRDRLRAVPVDDENGDGPILPSPSTIRDNSYRPLSRPVFVYVNTASLGRDEVKAFVDFYLTKADALVREVGYVPLNDREAQLVRDRFTRGTTGSMFPEHRAPSGTSLEALMAPSQ